uniref:MFS domain-containing protein n=1 Tax=Panagrellus redivivus TaxID=6233 RepID=A0A7E4VGT4_PANRE
MFNVKELITNYRNNRKVLLLIVYVALCLDNMLLTTVVPIIPEYLLRISHPNESDILLNNKIPVPDTHTRGKRQVDWDSAWDLPEPPPIGGTDADDDYDGPRPRPKPTKGPKKSKSTKTKSKTKQRTTTEKSLTEAEIIQQAKQHRHDTLSEENVHVGLMFGSKALVQLITNPFIGPVTNKIGYTIPMFTGFVIMFLSTLLFAFGSSFGTLWLARAFQGIGSACTSTSGMGMLAQAYPDDAERGSAMGIALGGLALGVLIGPPYGGILYQWAGKELPFLLLALLALLDGSLQFLALSPKIDRGEPEGSGIKQLISDPYILVAAGSITIGNLGIAMLEPSLPLWMMESWQAGSFQRGAAFLPASITYLIGTNIFGPLAHKIGRWRSCFIGLIVIGICLLMIPSAESIVGLIIPNSFMGFSIGMIDASMFPMMGFIVDVRHVGVYGSIYAIADAAFCFAFALGPFFSGPLVRTMGFPGMMYLIAVINFAYAPLLLFLRKLPEHPPIKENGVEVDGNAINYENIDGTTSVVNTNTVLSNPGYNYDLNQDWN